MARSRNIKPGFFRNADLVDLSMEARLLFIGLWTLADRDGRMEDRPKQIKMEIFPAENIDCDVLLNDIAKTGMLDRYEVDGKRYLHVVNFLKHQNPHRDEKASTIPAKCEHSANTVQAPCEHDATTMAIGLIPESGFLNPDPLTKDKAQAPFVLPDWIPADAWNGYVDMRKKLRKSMTARARTLVVKELALLRDAGHDVSMVLDTSTKNCWIDVYAPKDKKTGLQSVNAKPKWATDAGFETAWEAENADCYAHNAHQFRNGQRAEASA